MNKFLWAASHPTSLIPSLDGIQAVSVSIVLAPHAAIHISEFAKRPLLLYTIVNGNRVVSVL